jgi:hypothetical protein
VIAKNDLRLNAENLQQANIAPSTRGIQTFQFYSLSTPFREPATGDHSFFWILFQILGSGAVAELSAKGF